MSPQDMVDRRVEVVARLKALEDAAAPLVTFLQNANAVQELRADKQYNLQMLNDRYQVGPESNKGPIIYQLCKISNLSGPTTLGGLLTYPGISIGRLNERDTLDLVDRGVWQPVRGVRVNKGKDLDGSRKSAPQVQASVIIQTLSFVASKLELKSQAKQSTVLSASSNSPAAMEQDKEEVDELCRTLEEKEDSSCTASYQFSCITI
ncbi:hypothetical protein GOBAR_AA39486 [Gossypium barbadense]|uniref:Eukaryotic translation initiation factor 3 subunit E N-terminal domain-containing protein n=1 Tax=Gossypium barbadense TaxID=3634 RepID=A0A2P5VQW3_GOSBA|nr:hypothetical protein GOBAR_AA39486 [Gossypium barbadense]